MSSSLRILITSVKILSFVVVKNFLIFSKLDTHTMYKEPVNKKKIKIKRITQKVKRS